MRLDFYAMNKIPRLLIAVFAFASFLVTILAGGYFYRLDLGIREANQSVHHYIEDVESITDGLSALRDSIGYGGFIHHFKNYVIRRDEGYARRAREEMEQSLALADSLITAFHDADAVKNLLVVRATIGEYRDKLSFAVGPGKDMPVAELDALVKVDDEPALAALAELDRIRSLRLAHDLEIGDAAAETLISSSQLGFVLVGLIAVFGAVTVVIVFRTHRSMVSAFNEVDVLIEDAPNAIFTVDADGIIRRSNQDAAKLFGYTGNELIGLPIDQLVPEAARAGHKGNRQTYLDNPQPGPMTKREGLYAVDKSGREFPVEVDLSVIKRGSGDLVVAFVRDVSDLYQQKSELEEASKKALEASAAKSQFMAIMSHELRTPLNAVIGFAELVQLKVERGAASSELSSYAKNIGRSGRDLLGLINDILDFAKIDSGKFDVAEAPFYLSEVVGNIHSGFEAKATENGVELRTKVARMDNIVLGDSMRIRQVVYNLLDNAIKFGQGSPVEFEASVKALEKSQLELRVSVTDHGIGIETDRLGTIFDPFVQADATIARQYGGSGLGLSISRSLAQLMGGDISVTSVLGEGSTFTATFVLQDLKALTPKNFVQSLRKEEEQDNEFGMMVLAVDDVEPNLDVVETILMDMGCKVMKARDGREAVKWCQSHKPDVILMDIHMPVMNGIDAAAEIVEINGVENSPPIYAWTADVTCGDLLKSTSTPWHGIITKPTTRGDLTAALRRVMEVA